MIRFVDLTQSYWTDEGDATSCCAFLSTVDDRFLDFGGTHVVDSDAEIDELGDGHMVDRCRRLVPAGFWERRPSVLP